MLRRVVAGGLLVFALLVNKWTVEAFLEWDRAIESAKTLVIIGMFQFTFAAMAVAMWRSTAAWMSNVALLIIATIVTVASVELFFRVAVPTVSYPTPRMNETILNPDPDHPGEFVRTKKSIYASNPRGYFDEDNAVHHVLNRGGWHDIEHALEKPDGTFRIVGLGDSYLFGQGVRFKDNILTRLGGMMRESYDMEIEAINFGKSGSNTHDQLVMLGSVASGYQPDLVIVFYVLNDVETDLDHPRMDFFRNYTEIYQRPGLDPLSRHSRAWSQVRSVFLRAYIARRYIRMSVEAFEQDQGGWNLSREALVGIQEKTEAIGAELLLVIFPFFHQLQSDYPFQVIHDIVSTFARGQEIDVLDLRDAFPSYDGPELWVHETDQHPNEVAHKIAAEAVFRHISSNRQIIEPLKETLTEP